MIALMTAQETAIAIEPDMIESVEQHPAPELRQARCIIRTTSGKEYVIERSYTYVTGIIRNYYHPKPEGRHETH